MSIHVRVEVHVDDWQAFIAMAVGAIVAAVAGAFVGRAPSSIASVSLCQQPAVCPRRPAARGRHGQQKNAAKTRIMGSAYAPDR
jgi:hypothetical protein